jgi:hypothetical protein
MKIIAVLGLLALLSGCFSETTSAPNLKLNYADTPIELTKHVTGDWQMVCILGPYSDNELAQEVIGFSWPLESLSSVWINDGVSLLIFTKNESVQSYFEVARGKYDFNSLDEQCFNRSDAIFTKVDGQVVVFKQS